MLHIKIAVCSVCGGGVPVLGGELLEAGPRHGPLQPDGHLLRARQVLHVYLAHLAAWVS